MPGKAIPQDGPSQISAYAIKISGHLDPKWAGWLGNVTITLLEDGRTLIYCPELDQAALHGLLTRIRDLGVVLISVNLADPEQDNLPDASR